MSYKVEKVTEPVELGEGPHWDATAQALYYVNIPQGILHKYVPSTGAHTKTKLEGRGGFVVPVEGTSDQFVMGLERRFVVLSWDGAEGTPARVVKELGEVDQDIPTNIINDGKADPRGRIFAGTLGREYSPGKVEPNKGSLFRVDARGVHKLDSGITVSNGLAWDLKEKAFYYIDSFEYKIRRYDYDVETGDISNMRYIFDFKKNNIEGSPDGATIDTDGNLWVAVWGDSSVIQVDPRTSRLLRKVAIPALQVTSATWGGRDHDELYVTTASYNISGEQKPPCGATFRVTGLGAKGHPNLHARL